MNLLPELERITSNGPKTTKFHLPSACFSIISTNASENSISPASQLTSEYIKNMISKLDKLDDDGKSEEAGALEWLSTIQLLKYFETLDQKIDSALALSIVSISFKRLKLINERRYHINLGYFMVITELAIRFFADIEDYKTDEHRVKQKIFEQGSWLFKNIEAVAAYGEDVKLNVKSFQGLSLVDIMKLYFTNLTRLINVHSNALKQQNKALQRKAFKLLTEYRFDKEFTHVCLELVACLTQALSGQNTKSTLDGRIKLYFSNFLYLFDVLNPRKSKDVILTEFAYDPIFFSKEDNLPYSDSQMNLVFPVNDFLNYEEQPSYEDAIFYAQNLYKLILKALDEPQKDNLMPINIFYNLKVIERILVSDTEQIKTKKKTFDIEKGLSQDNYVKFSMKLKSLGLKLIRFFVEKYQFYIVRHLDWITNALYYLFVNFKGESFLLDRILKVNKTLMATLGVRSCSFTRFLYFKGGNMFGMLEKLFVSLFIKKDDQAPKEQPKVMNLAAKKGGKKKGGASLGFGKELRLVMNEENEFAFLDAFSKKEKTKIFVRLLQILTEYLNMYGKQENEMDVIVKIDNLVEMVMNTNTTSFAEFSLQEKCLLFSFFEAVAINNINNKQESMIQRRIFNYLERFASSDNGPKMQACLKRVGENIRDFHSNKVGMVIESQSMEELYAYYETKMKIMSNLEKRTWEEFQAAGANDEEDEEEEVQEKIVKKRPEIEGAAVEIHTKLFEEEKTKVTTVQQSAPVQQAPKYLFGQQKKAVVEEKPVVQKTEKEDKMVIEETIVDKKTETVVGVIREEVSTQVIEEKKGDTVVRQEQFVATQIIEEKKPEKMVIEAPVKAVEKKDTIEEEHSMENVVILVENEDGKEDEEDIEGLPMLNLESP